MAARRSVRGTTGRFRGNAQAWQARSSRRATRGRCGWLAVRFCPGGRAQGGASGGEGIGDGTAALLAPGGQSSGRPLRRSRRSPASSRPLSSSTIRRSATLSGGLAGKLLTQEALGASRSYTWQVWTQGSAPTAAEARMLAAPPPRILMQYARQGAGGLSQREDARAPDPPWGRA